LSKKNPNIIEKSLISFYDPVDTKIWVYPLMILFIPFIFIFYGLKSVRVFLEILDNTIEKKLREYQEISYEKRGMLFLLWSDNFEMEDGSLIEGDLEKEDHCEYCTHFDVHASTDDLSEECLNCYYLPRD
jgi:hypothetical protein